MSKTFVISAFVANSIAAFTFEPSWVTLLNCLCAGFVLGLGVAEWIIAKVERNHG